MKKLNITAKSIIRELAKISIFLFFMPISYVSLFGVNVQISLSDIMMGTISGNSGLYDGQPLLFIGILMPIVILVASFIQTIEVKVKGAIAAVASLIEIVLLIVANVKIAELVEDNWLTSSGSFWFFVFVVVTLVLLVLSTLVYLGIMSWEGNVNSIKVPDELKKNVGDGFAKFGTTVESGINKISDKINRPSIPADKIAGYCQKCGSPYEAGTKFCTNCGNPIPAETDAK